MLIKSVKDDFHSINLKHYVYLNMRKCDFSVKSEKFLAFMVNERGIEANLDKFKLKN